MSTTPPSLIDNILNGIEAVLGLAGNVLPGSAYLDVLIKVAQGIVTKYEARTGTPMDVTLIKPIDRIP